jgi:hypothetical protein
MISTKRHYKKWTIPEVLNLQREYELLEWNVQQIANKHERTIESILFKLHSEGLTSSLYEAKGYCLDNKTSNVNNLKKSKKGISEKISDIGSSTDLGNDIYDLNSDDNISFNANINTLSDCVWNLETSVEEISSMVKKMFDQMPSQKKNKKCSSTIKH